MSTYAPHPKGVEVNGSHGPFVLTLEQADRLLGIYLEAGARREFNALHDAICAHPEGIPWLTTGRAA